MRTFEFNREKFDRLVHYIIWKCPDKAKLGSVKLHKILWKSDTSFFLRHGHPITGTRYVKGPNGPMTPALNVARDDLAKAGAIRFWRDRQFAGKYAKDVYEVLRPASESFLSTDEKQTVDFWINEICLKHTAESISDETHGVAWEIARMGEEMPVQVALVERGREPNKDEMEWARKKAKERGLI